MDREEVKQRVLDALGVILVDKTHIRDDATFAELSLDEEDIQALFQRLEEIIGYGLPKFIKERARRRPRHVGLPMIIDLLVMMQQEPADQVLPGKSGQP